MLQKLTLHLDSFWKTLRLECVDTFTFRRIILLWKDLNLYVHKVMTNLEEGMQKMDIANLLTRETANTKWKFYELTNLTIFASLLKKVPMGCKDTVLPERILRNCNVKCLTFEGNTRQPYTDKLCFFTELALHLRGNEKLEKDISKISKIFSITVRKETSEISKCSFE